MTASQRIAALDDLAAEDLCQSAASALTILVDVINEETTLLRAGRVHEAAALTNRKIALAQDYVGWARAVQRQASRLKQEAPEPAETLRRMHESLATQLADNLKVIATAKAVTEDLLGDVARQLAAGPQAKTYGATGALRPQKAAPNRGLSVNRAL